MLRASCRLLLLLLLRRPYVRGIDERLRLPVMIGAVLSSIKLQPQVPRAAAAAVQLRTSVGVGCDVADQTTVYVSLQYQRIRMICQITCEGRWELRCLNIESSSGR